MENPEEELRNKVLSALRTAVVSLRETREIIDDKIEQVVGNINVDFAKVKKLFKGGQKRKTLKKKSRKSNKSRKN